ncbi:T9SS ring complex lipoprotein PorK/GldK [Ochrovirga pacifica]|uniref:type IX secretion system lipoprotein PorK/GldK n=1 Tax=Ochrovirga pacifica TaxID=1042376 RepID=UPI000255A539|nr:gliding motility lipoprotein GldK [Ochrovirga pacifica]
MKKLIFLLVIAITLVGCSKVSDRGELVGAKSELWFAERPYGMVLIPGGTFTMGKTDENRWGAYTAPVKDVSVKEFFMDDTEITNSEYKEFVYWVRDSIVRTELAIFAESATLAEEGGRRASIADYKYQDLDIDADSDKINAYQKYMLETYGSISRNHLGSGALNWDVPIVWEREDYPDEAYAEVMEQLYLPSEDVGEKRVFDVELLKYSYLSTHKTKDATKNNTDKKVINDRIDINIYPDTTVWAKDFKYSYNDVMVSNYFWHSAFEEYPVVGVTWNQANAFCNWRTKKKNDFLRASESGIQAPDFRLPTEAEWEFAARGGIQNGKFPWGGPYVVDKEGYYLANFKPKRNDSGADGFIYTVEAKSFPANDYGLYNMAGNVSEWTSNAYNMSSAYISSSLNVNIDDPANKRKIVRGGSWKDIAYFLEVSTQDYEYADSAKSYIGFRTVQDYLGDIRTNK